jgi:hypothetical protein
LGNGVARRRQSPVDSDAAELVSDKDLFLTSQGKHKNKIGKKVHNSKSPPGAVGCLLKKFDTRARQPTGNLHAPRLKILALPFHRLLPSTYFFDWPCWRGLLDVGSLRPPGTTSVFRGVFAKSVF